MIDLTREQLQLLLCLVATARLVTPQLWEFFVAARVGYGGWTIVHPRAPILALKRLADLERLEDVGLLNMRSMPSGARIFQLTPCAFSVADADAEDGAD